MPNREKVIKGIECCEIKGDCIGCPYDVEQGLPACKQLAIDALELLKEQEAVPVTQHEIMHMLFWCCGSCGVAITDGDKFCRMCGKAVKWNDID